MVLMESRDSEGVPFASLESLWPGIWQIDACRVPKSGYVTITKIEILHVDTQKNSLLPKMLFFSIYDKK